MNDGLSARTWRLAAEDEVDLLTFAGSSGLLFQRSGTGFAGRGEALRVRSDRVVDALAGIEVLSDEIDGPGSGPVAFGAFPFLPGVGTELVVPELMVGRDADGARWLTVVGRDVPATAPPLPDAERPVDDDGVGPSSFQVTSSRPPADWKKAVAAATDRLDAGELDKVVLAREIVVTADRPIPVDDVLLRLRHGYPDCFIFSVDGFLGASPELLVSRHGDVVRAQPMAGTAPRRGDPEADARLAAALLADPTYRHEHQVTIDVVHDTLLRFSSYVDYEPEPTVVALANVAHLATSVEGRLSHPPASVLDLVEALHPTPAVCGRPREVALALIAEIEDLDRDRYAGAVGWVDAGGNGQWAVSIRCALVDGPVARVYGGNGIVSGSDPATELNETRAKLQAMLGAIVRP
jgi:menaquinone-specific isochorismate synthase